MYPVLFVVDIICCDVTLFVDRFIPDTIGSPEDLVAKYTVNMI